MKTTERDPGTCWRCGEKMPPAEGTVTVGGTYAGRTYRWSAGALVLADVCCDACAPAAAAEDAAAEERDQQAQEAHASEKSAAARREQHERLGAADYDAGRPRRRDLGAEQAAYDAGWRRAAARDAEIEQILDSPGGPTGVERLRAHQGAMRLLHRR